jgi:hypothetical protein
LKCPLWVKSGHGEAETHARFILKSRRQSMFVKVRPRRAKAAGIRNRTSCPT